MKEEKQTNPVFSIEALKALCACKNCINIPVFNVQLRDHVMVNKCSECNRTSGFADLVSAPIQTSENYKLTSKQACEDMLKYMEENYINVTMDKDRYGFAIEAAKEYLKTL